MFLFFNCSICVVCLSISVLKSFYISCSSLSVVQFGL